MKRLVHAAIAMVAMVAILVCGPVGSGGMAAAAGPTGGQESQLEREVDGLSAGQRTQLELRLSERLKENGIDLADPTVQARLARALGVSTAEVSRAVEGSDIPSAGPPAPGPIAMLFVAATLLFAPAVFQSIGGTLYGWLAEIGAIEGIEQFGG